MAHPPPEPAGEDPTRQAYAALEKLYSEGRWCEVEVASQNLLNSLTEGGEWGARVELLLAHTRLYGFADPEGAAAHYQQVLGWCEAGEGSSNISSSNDFQPNPEALAILRSIAAAGMAQCQPQPADPRPQPAPTLTASLEPTVHATPWLAAPASDAAHAPDSTPALGGENTFSTFVQPVQIAKTPEIDTVPPITDHTPAPREATAANPMPPNDNNPQSLSPKDHAELAQGLLKVVICAN